VIGEKGKGRRENGEVTKGKVRGHKGQGKGEK